MTPLFKKLPLLLAVPFLTFSCDVMELVKPEEAPAVEEGITYAINTGGHETTNPIKVLSTNSLRFDVQFDSTAIYATKDPSNQADINKLYGMSDCGTFHHDNSARFGWRWYKNKLELHAYSYNGGKNTSTFITAIDLKKNYTCELTLTESKYIYKVGEKTVEHARACNGEGKGYQLYPYFGGDETAPHDIKIKIKVLK
ncbi:hypothetical protein ACFSC6_01740 [Rufibacter sediminis]|uniref:Lipoprotein n=1 Tax=Rufibacter sediminis TaxID=2762756 RepID=A0ABR6VWY8_9BACT|nr:hypothetical protein [Rufibacter sediminis]MBC3541707.1 hypothetical protein [Rufibacter sediminis]